MHSRRSNLALAFDPIFQLAGLLVLTQLAKVDGEVTSREQSVGVVLTQHPAAADQGVLVEFTGPFVLIQVARDYCSKAKGALAMPSSGKEGPQTPWRAVTNWASEGLLHGFWPQLDRFGAG
jgi:hypothetical protein